MKKKEARQDIEDVARVTCVIFCSGDFMGLISSSYPLVELQHLPGDLRRDVSYRTVQVTYVQHVLPLIDGQHPRLLHNRHHLRAGEPFCSVYQALQKVVTM